MTKQGNENLKKRGFIHSAMGYSPTEEITEKSFTDISKITDHRLGQFIMLFSKLHLRTSSNILAHRKELLLPCSVKDLQRLVSVKERAFWNFLKEIEEHNLVKIIGGVIYVNPLFAVSSDMDYIRKELMEMFPDYRNELESMNKTLNRTINEEL